MLNDSDFEKIYKYFYPFLIIFIILLFMFLIIPDGTELYPLWFFFDVSKEGGTAIINKPTGSEIVALVLIIIGILIGLKMHFRHKEIMMDKKQKQR